MRKVIGIRIGSSCPLDIIFSSPSGRAITLPRRSGVKLSRAECWIRKPESLKFRNSGDGHDGYPDICPGMAEAARKKLGSIRPGISPSGRSPARESREPSIPSTKRRIEEAWVPRFTIMWGLLRLVRGDLNARLKSGGLHVNEALFLTQLEDVEHGCHHRGTGEKGKDRDDRP